MKRVEISAAILHTLRERGVRVAIDDFGTGYSSLSYLRKFPVDALKIDQSFVRQISTAGDDTTLVTAVIGMARNLRLRSIAEGVETLQELEFLREHHCEEAQGYYLGRPVAAERMAELLRVGIPHAAGAAGSPIVLLDPDAVRGMPLCAGKNGTADAEPLGAAPDLRQTASK
jgi:EAL domain-containing protein (putative c-di-GMP-specific phosphodiesterase class I)